MVVSSLHRCACGSSTWGPHVRWSIQKAWRHKIMSCKTPRQCCSFRASPPEQPVSPSAALGDSRRTTFRQMIWVFCWSLADARLARMFCGPPASVSVLRPAQQEERSLLIWVMHDVRTLLARRGAGRGRSPSGVVWFEGRMGSGRASVAHFAGGLNCARAACRRCARMASANSARSSRGPRIESVGSLAVGRLGGMTLGTGTWLS